MGAVTTRFRSGHEDLDRQLRLLLTMLAELEEHYRAEATGDGDPDLIDDSEQFLLGYYDRYRQEQEYAMERCGYPAAHKHAVHHRKFLVQLKELCRSLATAEEKLARLRCVHDEFVRLHVQTLDKDLARFQRIRQRGNDDRRPGSGIRLPVSIH